VNPAPHRPFSKRHQEAVSKKRISPSLPKRLRKRLWLILQEYDYDASYHPTPGDNWIEHSMALLEIPKALKKAYGVDELEAFVGPDERGPVDLDGFVMGAYPAQVLDVVEVFYVDMPDDERPAFQQEVNAAMQEEGCPWLLCDGMFFQVDSAFLDEHVLARAHELLATGQFEGALQEFAEARNDFASRDYKGTVHNACKAFESVLKAVEDRQDGNAKELIKGLEGVGFYDGLPGKFGSGFGQTVLMGLPFIRNRMGGHGQGSEVVDVPPCIAELALHLAGRYIVLIMKRHIELTGKPGEAPPENTFDITDDDIPF